MTCSPFQCPTAWISPDSLHSPHTPPTQPTVTAYVVGFHCDPQPVALRPFPLPFPPSDETGAAAASASAAAAPAPASKKKKKGKPEEEKETEGAEAKAKAGSVGSPFEQMGKGAWGDSAIFGLFGAAPDTPERIYLP